MCRCVDVQMMYVHMRGCADVQMRGYGDVQMILTAFGLISEGFFVYGC